MGYRAVGRYIRVSPRKVRGVIELIKGKGADKALAILESLNKPTALYVKKVLSSAIANAKALSDETNIEGLYISKILADEGPALKRHKAGAMGRAMPRRRRSSHIYIEIESR